MAVTNALVPFQGVLPARASIDGLLSSLNRNPHRPRGQVLHRVFKPREINYLYGSDGEEVTHPKIGTIIDLFV